MEDYYEYLDSDGVTTLYKLIKDDTVALIDGYSVTLNGITTNLDTHISDSDIHTPITDIENMIGTAIDNLNYATPDYVDTKVSGLVNSAPEILDTLKELSDALGNDPNFATTVANQIGTKANKDSVYTKQETDTLLEGKANSVHNHVVSDITDMPTIPTKLSELTNDKGYITNVAWEDVTSKPELSQVAISGSYSDLNNTPTIPTKLSQLENDMGFGTGGGSGDTSDCVHKTGNETIDGTKTFTSSPWVINNQTAMGFSIKNTALARNDIPTAYQHYTFRAYDKNNNIMGEYCIEKSTNGDALLNMGVHSEDSSGTQISYGMQFRMTNDGSLVRFMPSANNKVHLGDPNAKWLKVHSDDVVHTSGDEDISGYKKFTADIVRKYTAVDITTTPTSDMYAHVNFTDKNNKTVAYIQYAQKTNGVDYIGLRVRDKNSTTWGVQLNTNREFVPLGNNSFSLGSASYKWANVYATTVNGNLKGTIDSTTTATTQATSDNSTKIATTAWVRTYVDSVAGSNTVGSSVSAYWSNSSNVTATGQASAGGNYPACYSEYITKTPVVGTIYSGAQLYTVLNTYASATGYISNSIYFTNNKAQATLSNPLNSSAKYLCTTANTFSFRAYTATGNSSSVGASSVVNATLTKSIFIRVQ